jgi:folylpolyglutamate synthase/dihydropteroate synthase
MQTFGNRKEKIAMEALIEKVKQIKELNELMNCVINICSNKDDNLVLKELKQQKTNTFAEAQEIAKSLLYPAKIKKDKKAIEEVNA